MQSRSIAKSAVDRWLKRIELREADVETILKQEKYDTMSLQPVMMLWMRVVLGLMCPFYLHGWQGGTGPATSRDGDNQGELGEAHVY